MDESNKEENVQQFKRGRPFDSGFYDRETFIKLVTEAFSDALDTYDHPKQQDIADIMKISRPTLCRYLKKYISWRKVQDEGYVYKAIG